MVDLLLTILAVWSVPATVLWLTGRHHKAGVVRMFPLDPPAPRARPSRAPLNGHLTFQPPATNRPAATTPAQLADFLAATDNRPVIIRGRPRYGPLTGETPVVAA